MLAGAGGPPQDVVLLNTAATLVVAGQATDLRDGASKAREAISSGAAAEKLKSFATLSQGLS